MSEGLDTAGEFQSHPTRPLRVAEIFRTSYIDSTGIPLASDREDPDLIRDIDFQKQPNPFRDSPSRYPDGIPHEVPVSGLERSRLRQYYPDMLSLVDRVRSTYIDEVRKETGRDVEAPLTLEESFGILFGLSYLPHYLVYRSTHPFAAQGELPPPVVVLSNAASGARGAIAAVAGLHVSDALLMHLVPNKAEAISAIEQMGRLIGENTVCAASPGQIDHFLEAVIEGLPKKMSKKDFLNDELPNSEIMSVVRFGMSFSRAEMLTTDLKQVDYNLTDAILRSLHRGQDPQAVLKLFLPHINQLQRMLVELTAFQAGMNTALGRNSESAQLTLNSLKRELNLSLPNVLSFLKV